jgi:Leucine-rich repeat (LRR) protein
MWQAFIKVLTVVGFLLLLVETIRGQEAMEREASKIIALRGDIVRDERGIVRTVSLSGPQTLLMGRGLGDVEIESIDFRAFPELIALYISASNATDRSIDHLEKMGEGLGILYVSMPRVTDKRLSGLLKKQQALASLSLINGSIAVETLEEIGKLPDLVNLSLKGSRISNEGLKHIAKHKKIRVLDLAETKVSDMAIMQIVQMRKLNVLKLRGTGITDMAIESLLGALNLRELDLRSTGVTDDGIRSLQSRRPDLKILK